MSNKCFLFYLYLVINIWLEKYNKCSTEMTLVWDLLKSIKEYWEVSQLVAPTFFKYFSLHAEARNCYKLISIHTFYPFLNLFSLVNINNKLLFSDHKIPFDESWWIAVIWNRVSLISFTFVVLMMVRWMRGCYLTDV